MVRHTECHYAVSRVSTLSDPESWLKANSKAFLCQMMLKGWVSIYTVKTLCFPCHSFLSFCPRYPLVTVHLLSWHLRASPCVVLALGNNPGGILGAWCQPICYPGLCFRYFPLPTHVPFWPERQPVYFTGLRWQPLCYYGLGALLEPRSQPICCSGSGGNPCATLELVADPIVILSLGFCQSMLKTLDLQNTLGGY